MKCPKCGKTMNVKDSFCKNCGNNNSIDDQKKGISGFNIFMIVVSIFIVLVIIGNFFKENVEKADKRNEAYYKCLDRESKKIGIDSYNYDSYEIIKKCIRESRNK